MQLISLSIKMYFECNSKPKKGAPSPQALASDNSPHPNSSPKKPLSPETSPLPWPANFHPLRHRSTIPCRRWRKSGDNTTVGSESAQSFQSMVRSIVECCMLSGVSSTAMRLPLRINRLAVLHGIRPWTAGSCMRGEKLTIPMK